MTRKAMFYECNRLQRVHDDLGNDWDLAYERLRLRQKIECLKVAIGAGS